MADDTSHLVKVMEALQIMRASLPQYVIESLVASGYDTLSAISEIEEPGSLSHSRQWMNSLLTSTYRTEHSCT